jgi:ABC-type sulfate transport system permease subunit
MNPTKIHLHESLTREEEVQGSSDRAFGIVFTVVFALIGLFPLLRGREPRLWALGVAAAFLLAALVFPRVLGPLNRLWFRFGMLLHRVVSPVVLGVIYFLVFTPLGVLMRALGKRPLSLSFDSSARSYWVVREPAAPPSETMKRQF